MHPTHIRGFRMKKILLILIAIIGFGVAANAQSTIYFFYGKMGGNYPLQIQFNGQETFLLKKKTKKVCNMQREGKLNISFEKSFNVGAYNLRVDWADEIQLNLTRNSVHYILLKSKKGGYVMEFVELTEAQGKKELTKKDYDNTFAYDEP